jgi:hypothetical protein
MRGGLTVNAALMLQLGGLDFNTFRQGKLICKDPLEIAISISQPAYDLTGAWSKHEGLAFAREAAVALALAGSYAPAGRSARTTEENRLGQSLSEMKPVERAGNQVMRPS